MESNGICIFLSALLGQTNMELMMLSTSKNTRAMAPTPRGASSGPRARNPQPFLMPPT